MKPPCYGCADRHEACHVTCRKYISYAEENAQQREKRWKERLQEQDIIQLVINTIEKTKKHTKERRS